VADVINELTQLRERVGLSIRELAQRAGVSPSTIWRIEHRRMDPTVGMVDRLRGALESAAGVVEPVVRRDAIVSLALGQATAAKVLADPDRHCARARRRIAAMSAQRGLGELTLRSLVRWQRLLDGPLEGVVAALIDSSDDGYELRQSTPFAGLLTDDERARVIRRARRAH
jgi:transcriptional regulator with XRE-family HTH domain